MLDTTSVVTVQRLKNEDTKRKSEAIRGTTVSEVGWESYLKHSKNVTGWGPYFSSLKNIACAAYPHKCVEERQEL